MFTTWYRVPPPHRSNGIKGLAGILGTIFERKGVTPKYCGIRSYEFLVVKVVFSASSFCRVKYRLSKNAGMVFGAASQVGRFDGCLLPNQGTMVAFGERDVCDGGTRNFVMKKRARWI